MCQPYPGGARMPEAQRPPVPASVRNAVKVMYAGVVASLVYGLTIPFAAPAKLVALVVWLVGLAAVTLLWRGTSSAFLKATPS
jgi:hypothetical protein